MRLGCEVQEVLRRLIALDESTSDAANGRVYDDWRRPAAVLRRSRPAQRTFAHAATSYACQIPGPSAAGREVTSLRRAAPTATSITLRTRGPAIAAVRARDSSRAARTQSSLSVVDVVVVDGDPIVRRAVVDALSADGIRALGVTASGRDGARLAAELGPAVVIANPQLDDIGGMELVRTLRCDVPHAAILLLSADETEDFALRALAEGASGVLSRRVSHEALPRVVRGLAAGEAVMTRALSMRLVELLRVAPVAGRGVRPVRSPLSTREWEVLDLICAGAGTRVIADELGLSAETVRSHVKRLLRKLGAHSRAEAAAIATRTLAECTPPGLATRP